MGDKIYVGLLTFFSISVVCFYCFYITIMLLLLVCCYCCCCCCCFFCFFFLFFLWGGFFGGCCCRVCVCVCVCVCVIGYSFIVVVLCSVFLLLGWFCFRNVSYTKRYFFPAVKYAVLLCPNFEEVRKAYCFRFSVLPSVRPSVCHVFETPHIFGTIYARVLKFHICIAYKKKLAGSYFVFLLWFFMVGLGPFQA